LGGVHTADGGRAGHHDQVGFAFGNPALQQLLLLGRHVLQFVGDDAGDDLVGRPHREDAHNTQRHQRHQEEDKRDPELQLIEEPGDHTSSFCSVRRTASNAPAL